MSDWNVHLFFEPGYWAQLSSFALRMLAAIAMGAALGMERESAGKGAGLRTHMLVTLTSAVLVMIPSAVGADAVDVSRIIQGMLAGIGFIGGGVILKLTAEQQVIGLTTAAGIWMTTAIGIATGLGCYAIALMTTVISILTLRLFFRKENSGNNHS